MSTVPKPVIVKREPPSQRRHYRLTAPAAVIIDGIQHTTRDWGLGGFGIPYFGDVPMLGETIDVQFALNFQGFEISFRTQAEIVHRTKNRLGARFVGLREREEALIKYFASAVIGGEMIEVKGALARVDRPVTPAAALAKPHTSEQQQQHGVRRKLIAAGYIVAGVALGGYVLLTLISYLSRVEVETAVINTGIEQVVSRDVGHVAEVYIAPGAEVQAGQPLLRVEDDQVMQWVTTATQDLGTAQTRLHDAQERLALAAKKFRVYQSISSDQLSSAKSQVVALTAERDAAKIEADRVKTLVDEGILAQQNYDQQKAILAGKQGALDHAQADLKTVESGANATNNGLMFSANYLVGDEATLKAEESTAAEQVQVAQATLHQAQLRQQELVYRAPYPGTVVRMYKSPGMTLDRGEQILILRHGDGERTIDAYLTQAEAASIQVGARGLAYVPGTDERYSVEVVEVDRTRGFVKELETPKQTQPGYNWRGAEDKSAYAKLVFVSLNDNARQKLAGGMPVFVNLPKKRYLSFMALFHRDKDATDQRSTGSSKERSKGGEPKKTESSSIFFNLIPQADAATQKVTTEPVLWPSQSVFMRDPMALHVSKDFAATKAEVLEEANKALQEPPAPVETLHSSGVSNKDDPSFQATRKAFGDADKCALLAMAYRLSDQSKYLAGAKRYILAWAQVNKPTGEPIDETRLDGFLWGIDLVRSEFTADEEHQVDAWLERWLAAKRSFSFGRISDTNNHKTHALKILVMLDKLLNRSAAYEVDLGDVKKQLDANLLPNGESIDYQQRDAMHYHIYDLEAWNEIALVTGCCVDRIDRAFAFFDNTLKNDPGHVEFAKTTAPIDQRRAAAGFDYAQAKNFDVHEAARAIFSYATLPGRKVNDDLWRAALEGKARKNLFYLARFYLWSAN